MNFIDGYLNRKFKKKRLEKYLREKNAEYDRKIIVEKNKDKYGEYATIKRDGVLK